VQRRDVQIGNPSTEALKFKLQHVKTAKGLVMLPDDSRLINRSGLLYQQCMREVKFRLNHAESMMNRLKQRHSAENEVLVAELVALQFRKIVELIGLGSIAANEKEYSRLRAEFHRDWNAKRIFHDLARVNPRFYPVPIAGLSDPKIKGGPSVIEEYDSGFLDRVSAVTLYDMCSSVLHAENPFGHKHAYATILSQFAEQIPLFKALLGNFWVNLVPANRAFCVWTYLSQPKDVDVALFYLGTPNTTES
jgi:hypothetical protein